MSLSQNRPSLSHFVPNIFPIAQKSLGQSGTNSPTFGTNSDKLKTVPNYSNPYIYNIKTIFLTCKHELFQIVPTTPVSTPEMGEIHLA